METVDDLIARLWTDMRTRGWSKCRLAHESARLALALRDPSLSLHVNTLTGFGKPCWHARLDTIRKIQRVLDAYRRIAEAQADCPVYVELFDMTNPRLEQDDNSLSCAA